MRLHTATTPVLSPHVCSMYGHTCGKSMDQPGKVLSVLHGVVS